MVQNEYFYIRVRTTQAGKEPHSLEYCPLKVSRTGHWVQLTLFGGQSDFSLSGQVTPALAGL